MVIRLYSEYIQKSRIFLYPILGIPKGSEAVPIESYVSWKDMYTTDDQKYICIYPFRDDDVFRKFEKSKLTNHKLFDNYYETPDDKCIYVFDLDSHKSDYQHFLNGTYANMSQTMKDQILKFYMNNKNTYHQINSYLNPEIYYEQYAKLLTVNEKLLREVGQLCDKPNLQKENLITEVKKIAVFNSL